MVTVVLSPNSAVHLSSTGGFSIFQLIVLWDTIELFSFIVTSLINPNPAAAAGSGFERNTQKKL